MQLVEMKYDDSLIAIVHELITFLGEISDEDQERAQRAIENIERDLKSYLSSTNEDELKHTLSSLQYSVGARGILDWIWNSKNRARLSLICEKFQIELNSRRRS